MRLIAAALVASAAVVRAATAEDWVNRSIYQIVTDRFAPPSDTAPARTDPLPAECNVMDQTWCGGTWLSIIDKLDYIQSMGLDAVWISPTSRNIDVHTPYNYAYHGYWVNDPTQLNERFGNEKDLRKLSDELHKRGMYLMVDIAINAVAALDNQTSKDSQALSDAGSLWTSPEYFHDLCNIDWSSEQSVENCWLATTNVSLMDVNTENAYVKTTLNDWISKFVSDFNVDGLRIDAAKHVPGAFWVDFCKAAGVYCIGEVFGDDVGLAAKYQTQGWMDAVLGFPYYNGIKEAFGVAPKRNMSYFLDRVENTLSHFPNPHHLANFIESHDVPRFHGMTADPQLVYNALVAQFVFEGIPIIYYGQEQDMDQIGEDPNNRAALWPTGYQNTTTLQRIKRLNSLRKHLIADDVKYNGESYLSARTKIVGNSTYDVALRKGPLLTLLTNRGSPESGPADGLSFSVDSGWPRATAVVDMLTCKEFNVGTGGMLTVSYTQQGYGGMPYVFMSGEEARKTGICTDKELGFVNDNYTNPRSAATRTSVSGLGGAIMAAAAALYLSL